MAVHGDLGWMSCLSKQKLEVILFYYKLYNIEQHRILHKIKVWSKRTRRSWDFKVHKLLSDLSLEPLLDAGLSKQLCMIEVNVKFVSVMNNDGLPKFGKTIQVSMAIN